MPGLNQSGDQPLPNHAGGAGKKYSHTSLYASPRDGGKRYALVVLASACDRGRRADPADQIQIRHEPVSPIDVVHLMEPATAVRNVSRELMSALGH